MIVLSVNYRGLASLPKKLAVQRFVEERAPDVLFLQESMGRGEVIMEELDSILNGWVFVSVDFFGNSGGLLLGWKLNCFHLHNAWVVVSGLSVTLFSIKLKVSLRFVNVYEPYIERESFWNRLIAMECFICSKLICGGDLKFSIGFF